MSFSRMVLAPWIVWVATGIALVALAMAVSRRPWQALLQDHAMQHRWLAATVAVTVLWQLRAQAVDWLTLHLMFTTLMTLLFRAPLALVSLALVNLALVLVGRVEWPMLGVNLLVTGVVPVLVTVAMWRWVDRCLPKHPMVFLFVGGFWCAALSSLAAGLAVLGLMALGSSDPQAMFQAQEYARFLPLLMPSEAFISGMLLSILMFHHPHWVATFNDQRYLDDR